MPRFHNNAKIASKSANFRALIAGNSVFYIFYLKQRYNIKSTFKFTKFTLLTFILTCMFQKYSLHL